MKYVDLSILIDINTPVYPGDPKVQIEPAGSLARDGYQDHKLSIGTHVGTHIDAPVHMMPKGKSLNLFSVDKFIGNGICIEVGKEITLNKIKRYAIKENDIVLLNTGMSKLFHQTQYFENYPAIPQNVAEYLVEKKVKMVGVDACSVDHEEFIAHKTLLRNEILIIENLTNLDKLLNKRFKIYALPLNLSIDGAPARVVAELLYI